MKKIIYFTISLIMLTGTASNLLAQNSFSASKEQIPVFLLLGSASPSDDAESSQIYGGEIQGNWRIAGPLALGFHGMIQKQKYNDFDTERWGLGLSLNYYMQIKSYIPFIGVKRTYYGDFGEDEEALDCLYCSDVDEDYSGGETYITVGALFDNWVLQFDIRISDEKSDWGEDAYDPWGVGSSYSKYYDGIPDPEFIFSLGYSW